MKAEYKKVILGEGIGELIFGMNTDQVIALLGEPDEIENFEAAEDEDDVAETWYYDELEMTLSFFEDADLVLDNIALSAPDTEIAGHKVIGLSHKEFEALLPKLDLGEITVEDISTEDYPSLQLISAHDSGVSFLIDDNKVTELQFGFIFDEEEGDED